MGKIKTPDWVLNGGEKKPKKKPEGKLFKVRKCPECGSDDVGVVLTGEEGSDEDELLATSSKRGQSKNRGEWECKKCKWVGIDVKEEELTEEEFMKYLDDKGEEVA